MKIYFFFPSSVFELSGRAKASLIILFILLVTSGMTVSAAWLTQLSGQDEITRMQLLEKLEKGQKLSGDEIRSCMKPIHDTDDFITGFELPELPDFPEFRCHPDICNNPPHIFIIPDHFEFDEEAMRDLKEDLSKSIDEMKREIESVINSDEMRNFHREMKELGEEIRKEVEKVIKEIKTEKEINLKTEGIRS